MENKEKVTYNGYAAIFNEGKSEPYSRERFHSLKYRVSYVPTRTTKIKKTRKNKIHPMLLELERIGLLSKSNGIEGKYLIGYKIAWKYKREWKRFCIKYHYSAKKALEMWRDMIQIDWEREDTLTW